jgi:hypothetical protein
MTGRALDAAAPLLKRGDEDRPPDLQALVAKHGGYHRITPEAAFDADRRNGVGRCA